VNILSANVTLGTGGLTMVPSGGSPAGSQRNDLAGYRGTPSNFSRCGFGC